MAYDSYIKTGKARKPGDYSGGTAGPKGFGSTQYGDRGGRKGEQRLAGDTSYKSGSRNSKRRY